MNLYFTSEIRYCLDLFCKSMEKRKISHRHSHSVGNPELGNFTVLFCRGRQRIVQRFIIHVPSYFCLVTFLVGVVVVVVCSASLVTQQHNCLYQWCEHRRKDTRKGSVFLLILLCSCCCFYYVIIPGCSQYKHNNRKCFLCCYISVNVTSVN